MSQSTAIVVAGIIIAGAIVFTNYYRPASAPTVAAGAQAAAQNLPTSVSVRAPSASDHIAGSPNAPVVLIEYSDFQCPYCTMIYPTLKRIVTESNGKIAWVMRELPLYQIHPNAEPAANAGECIAEQAGNTGWWKFADTVFANQSGMGDALYLSVAQSLHIDIAKYQACVTAKKYQNKIDADSQEAETAGGNGTPFTVVYGNGKQVPVSGALPYAQIMSVIQQVQGK